MLSKPIAELDTCDVWFVAPNETWTAEQTRDEFAMRAGPLCEATGQGRVVVRLLGADGFSLDCLPGRIFRTSIVGIAPGEWAFAIMEDRQ